MAKQYRYTVYYDTEVQGWRVEDFMEYGVYDTETEDFLNLEEHFKKYREYERLLAELIGDN